MELSIIEMSKVAGGLGEGEIRNLVLDTWGLKGFFYIRAEMLRASRIYGV